jgi:hypothetical protein
LSVLTAAKVRFNLENAIHSGHQYVKFYELTHEIVRMNKIVPQIIRLSNNLFLSLHTSSTAYSNPPGHRAAIVTSN